MSFKHQGLFFLPSSSSYTLSGLPGSNCLQGRTFTLHILPVPGFMHRSTVVYIFIHGNTALDIDPIPIMTGGDYSVNNSYEETDCRHFIGFAVASGCTRTPSMAAHGGALDQSSTVVTILIC